MRRRSVTLGIAGFTWQVGPRWYRWPVGDPGPAAARVRADSPGSPTADRTVATLLGTDEEAARIHGVLEAAVWVPDQTTGYVAAMATLAGITSDDPRRSLTPRQLVRRLGRMPVRSGGFTVLDRSHEVLADDESEVVIFVDVRREDATGLVWVRDTLTLFPRGCRDQLQLTAQTCDQVLVSSMHAECGEMIRSSPVELAPLP